MCPEEAAGDRSRPTCSGFSAQKNSNLTEAIVLQCLDRRAQFAQTTMANTKVAKEFYEVSKLSKYEFEPYWPEKKLKICVTGAGGFIASHLAKRLKSEGHYIIGCDWKRNEHMPVRQQSALIPSYSSLIQCRRHSCDATAGRDVLS